MNKCRIEQLGQNFGPVIAKSLLSESLDAANEGQLSAMLLSAFRSTLFGVAWSP